MFKIAKQRFFCYNKIIIINLPPHPPVHSGSGWADKNNMDKKDSIVINRKTFWALAPAMAIIGILISKHEPGPLILFIMGIVLGIFIQRGYKE